MSTNAENRVYWVDYAKAIAIYCVILSHLQIREPFKEIFNIGLIPLFFFLSGIFYRTEQKNIGGFKEYFKSRGIKRLIPYFFFNFITYIFWVFIGRKVGLDSDIETNPIKPFLGIFYGSHQYLQHYYPLWFLACLFTAESLFYFISRIKNKLTFWITIFLCCVVGYVNYSFNTFLLPWGFEIAIVLLVFFALGNTIGLKILRQDIHLGRSLFYLVFTAIIVYVIFNLNSNVDVFKNSYGNYLYFYLGAAAWIFFLVLLIKLVLKYTKPNKIILFVGRNILIVYALHLISITFIKGIMFYLLKIDIYALTGNLVFSMILSALAILALVPVILFINRYLPFVVGGKKHESAPK